MQRQSPPTDRVTKVLNLLAAYPTQQFTLTELTHRLSITKATCLGIVGALVREGYLRRDAASKSYALGPALLALGRAARDSFASVEVARPLLADLTERFGFSCTASTVIGSDIVVLERTGLPGDMDSAVQPGQRYPYAPPSGVVFAVWLSDQSIEHWLAAYPPVPIDHRRLLNLAESSRQLGYLVERLTDVSVPSYTLLAGLTAGNVPDAVVQTFNAIVAAFPDRYYLASDLGGDDPLPVSVIVAPTYSEHGTPDLLLGIFVLKDLAPSELADLGTAVRQGARAVTQQVGGFDPWAPAVQGDRSGRPAALTQQVG
jgi:DNA-binding IclR family transcriptional regulator